METVDSNIVDVDLSVVHKKRFRLDGDDTRIIELNTSDMLVITRLAEVYPKLTELSSTISDLDTINLDDLDEIKHFGEELKTVDIEMRKLLDYVFDSPISDICAPFGAMYDPYDGTLRFEYIISTLLKLYEKNYEVEYKKIQARVNKHTSKYTIVKEGK
jgi:hypothetical protein